MKISWSDLTVKFDHLSVEKITESWVWLIGYDKTPIMITSLGDMFLKDTDNKVYLLNTGEGKFEKVAENMKEFNDKLKDQKLIDEWFFMKVVAAIIKSGKALTDGMLYAYKLLPALGGEMKPDNFEIKDIVLHFSLTGQIHKQIADFPASQ